MQVVKKKKRESFAARGRERKREKREGSLKEPDLYPHPRNGSFQP